jgi:hypothetical protein
MARIEANLLPWKAILRAVCLAGFLGYSRNLPDYRCLFLPNRFKIISSGREARAQAAVDASSYKRPIDNLQLFLEGGHTQIKRAYELSVCLKKQRQSSPIIASAGVPGS